MWAKHFLKKENEVNPHEKWSKTEDACKKVWFRRTIQQLILPIPINKKISRHLQKNGVEWSKKKWENAKFIVTIPGSLFSKRDCLASSLSISFFFLPQDSLKDQNGKFPHNLLPPT